MAATVLVTRPREQAASTARRLAALGFAPVLAPCLVLHPRRLATIPPVRAVLVTSANAIPALPARLHKLPLLAVGDATATRARAAGFRAVTSAGRDAAALAALVARQLDPRAGPLLLATAEGQGAALATALRAAGFRVVRRVAYATRPAAALPSPARLMLARRGVSHALFFSPASAAAAQHLLRSLPTQGITALAISAATAAALSPLKWAGIRVASSPDQDALLALLPPPIKSPPIKSPATKSPSIKPGGHAP